MHFSRLLVCVAIFTTLTAPMSAAQFQFSTLIRWGANGTGNTGWELGIGNTSALGGDTEQAVPHFATNGSRLFAIDYVKSTNTASLILYNGTTATGPTDVASFNPTGGNLTAANAIWTLPASAFFVQAANELTSSSIDVTNLSLVVGTTLSPLQTTPLSEGQFLGAVFGGGGTVNANSNVTFVGNAAGNWRLQGIITMSATAVLGNPSVTALTFGVSASANDAVVPSPVPEPMTSTLIGIGLLGLALKGRTKLSGAAKA